MSRIVMLTDDVPIDRRILQEAGTLLRDGHQIILLAGHAEGLPHFENLDGVRVERFTPPSAGRRELLTTRTTSLVGRAVNKASAISQSFVARGILASFRSAFFFNRSVFAAVRVSLGLGRRVARRVGVRASSSRPPFTLRAARRAHDSVHLQLTRTQPRVAHVAVKATARMWRLIGMANAKSAGPLVLLARRSRRVPIRDIALANRTAYYRPDVVHAHDLPQLRAAVLAAEQLGVPMVYDAHELYPEIGTLTPKQQRQLGRIEQKFIRRCTATITVNPYIAEEMARRYAVPAPVVVLNAIDEADAPSEHGGLRQALRLNDDDRIVLFQGWLSPTRGLDHLIRAMAHTSEHVHLVFMSYGDMVQELEAQAAALGLSERVHFHPAVPQVELLGWTASADVGVIPYPAVDLNHHFCSPNKLFEFIQARLPIVANDLPFLRDVIIGEAIGAVAPIEDSAAFGAAIEATASASDERHRELRDALDRAAPRYSWQSQEEAIRFIYRTIGAGP